jgi:hypothetical protein
MRHDMPAKDVANEQHYTEFLKEVPKPLISNSIDRTLDDAPKQASFRRRRQRDPLSPLGLVR